MTAPFDTSAEFFAALSGTYSVVRELGRGGMATVYLANDLRHKRAVAVKVLRPEIVNSISVQRFLREIEIVSHLTHPNILPLHDSGEAAGQPFFVMPFIEGHTLRYMLAERGVLPAKDAIRLISGVADALSYAHAHDVVHRDIKPENILIVAGHAVVSDFGIARAMNEATSERLTSAELVIGTPAYMSPEQARPGAQIDGRSDIYSLAVVLHEMLFGVLPTHASSGSKPPWRTPLRAFKKLTGSRAVPPHVELAIRRALSPDPDARFATATDFARALSGARPLGTAKVAVGAAAALALAIFVAAQLTNSSDTPTLPIGRRVVVQPFTNNTGINELDYLGLMAADWITEGLQRTAVVDVVPTPTALQASHFVESQRVTNPSGDPVKLLSAETGATIVIAGAYYRNSDHIDMQLQVIDARGAKLLGTIGPISAPVSSPASAIEQVRSRAMSLLSMTVDNRLAAGASLPVQPPTFEAYREFSQGLENYIRTEYAAAGGHFASAFRTDSTLVTALLMESISVSNLGEYARADSLLDALAGHRAQLSAYDAHWFDYRRSLMRGDRAAALTAVREIVATAPGTKATYNLAVEALQNGYLDEAERAIESLPPDRGPMRGWALYWDVRSRIRHLRGEYNKEMDDGVRARAAYPSRRLVLTASIRAGAALGRVDELNRLLDTAQKLPDDPLPLGPGDLALEAATELRAHGRATQARTFLLRAVQWYDDQAGRRALTASELLSKARSYYELARWDETRRLAADLSANSPANAEYLGLEGAAAAHLGDTATLRRVSEVLAAIPRRYNLGVATFAQARLAAVRGDRDNAVALLRQSLAEGHEYDLWVHRDVDFATLFGFPPYDELIVPRGRQR